MVTAPWELTILEKSRINVSFLRVDVRYGVGSKIFNNCDICYRLHLLFFVKYSGRPVIYILTTSAQRERRNNAASPNLLKLNSLGVGVFFRSAFAVHVPGATKLFLIVSETIFWHLKSRESTNSLYCC